MTQWFPAEPWPWWMGGLVIGALVPLLYYFLNTALGVSTGFGNFAKLLFPKTTLSWLNSKSFSSVVNHRFYMMMGMLIGAFSAGRVMGLPVVTIEMGVFSETLQWPIWGNVLWFLMGGFLLGLGARIAGGCTSGHSIHGLANFQLSSLVATICFLIFGAVTVFAIRVFLMGGV